MRVAAGFRNLVRRAHGRILGTAVVLLYHRVGCAQADPWSLSTTPEHFAEQMDFVRRYCHPLPLTEFVGRLRSRDLPPRAVAVTFDDGYTDNLHVARPLLEKHDVPATIFVCTGAVDQTDEYWWDELTRILLRSGTLPDVLRLQLGVRQRSWTLGAAAAYDDQAAAKHHTWRAFQRPPTHRHRIYLEVWQSIRDLSPNEREDAMAQLRTWAGPAHTRPGVRDVMSGAEIAEMDHGGLVDIGAHTVNHPRLATLPMTGQRAEIERSKADLEEILGRRVRTFAYPFGGPEDYSRASVQAVREAGFACAVVAHGAFVTTRDDPYQLPRLYMDDMDAEAFGRLLARFLSFKS